jgi:hypothetical protein
MLKFTVEITLNGQVLQVGATSNPVSSSREEMDTSNENQKNQHSVLSHYEIIEAHNYAFS